MSKQAVERKLNTTKGEIERFKSSVLWADIRRELKAWSHGFNLEMSSIVDDAAHKNESTAAVLMHLGDLNGRQKAVAYFLSMLDIFAEDLQEKADDAKRESADRPSTGE